jgi:hypothetical protein
VRIPEKNNHLQEEKREEKNRAGAEFCAVRSCVPFESLRHLTLRADPRATVRPGATVAPPFLSENFKQRSPLKKKDEAPLRFGFAFSFALFARDPRAPHPARPRKFCKKYRQGTIEATFERKRDTRDFARFCACFATALPKIPSLAIFRDFFVF